MLRFFSLSCCLAALLGFAAYAQAETVAVPNGDFSAQPLPDGGYFLDVPQSWTFSGDYIGVSRIDDAWGNKNPFGFVMVAADKNAVLYQANIGTNYVQGNTYQLDFDYCVPAGQPFGMDYKAMILYNGIANALADKTVTASINSGWKHYSISGVADASVTGSIGIGFQFLPVTGGTGYSQAYLDNVTLTTRPVPEPSTIALVAASVASLLAYAWRKRK